MPKVDIKLYLACFVGFKSKFEMTILWSKVWKIGIDNLPMLYLENGKCR